MLRKNYTVLHQEKRCNAKVQAKFCFSVLIVLFTLFSSCSKDDPKSEEVIVTVQTEDKTFTIDENPKENQLIGTVPGTTNQGSVTFSIIEQIPVGAFSIDAKTGQLYVDKTSIYDYETNHSVSGKIKVVNGNVSKESVILITINDVVEDIYYGSVQLRSQEEIDEFGLNSYREITGDLEIVEGDGLGSPINDLSSLNTVEIIGGELSVVVTSVLTTLEGLNNIKHADKCIIFNNPNIEDISALQGILTLNFINVSFNPNITSLSAFSNIENLEQGCKITENNSLTSLFGLNNLSSTGFLEINQNKNLNNIIDLNSLISIDGELILESNPNLVNLDGLNSLETVLGKISISGNNNLLEINGIQNLSSIGDELILNFNDKLLNIDGLINLTSMFYLQIFSCDSLENLNGLVNLNSIGEKGLYISQNDSLNDFCGIASLLSNNYTASYTAVNNLYNPTIEDILNDNCSN